MPQLAERNNRWSALYKTVILFVPRVYSGGILAQVVHAERLWVALAVPLMGRPGIGGVLGIAVETAARRFADNDPLIRFAQPAAGAGVA
jgi:hypothetical protein